MGLVHPTVQDGPLLPLIDAFLADLAHQRRSPHTQRAYAADLARFASFHAGPVEEVSPDMLQAFFDTLTARKPATRARAQAALASFLAWAQRHALIATTPMAHVARVRHATRVQRGYDHETIQAVLDAIPVTQRRDHLLFRLLAATGLRVDDVLALSIEDIVLAADQASLRVPGPGQQWRTIRLDEPDLLQEVRSYLTHLDATRGLLFQALKNGGAGPLRYQVVQARWQRYCAHAGISCMLHQLRHAHASVATPVGMSTAPQDRRLERTSLPPRRRAAVPSSASVRPTARPAEPPSLHANLGARLRQSRPFRELPDAALAEVVAMARCAAYHRGELYVDPAATFEHFYVVLRGRVSLYRLTPDGRKLTIDLKQDGDVFWFTSRDAAGGAKSCAEVLRDGTLICRLALRDVRHLMLAHAPFAVALFDELLSVTARLTDRLEELAYDVVAVRLAHTLAARAQANADHMVTETHDELAWLTGASRATVTKELQRLRAARLIATHPHHHGIHVPDPGRLRML